MPASQIQDEIQSLLWQMEWSEATTEQVQRLDTLVVGSLEARRYFVAYTRLLADLRCQQRLETWVQPPDDWTPEAAPSPWQVVWERINTVAFVSLTIAALVMISLVLSLALLEVRLGPLAGGPPADAPPEWVARITATDECRWSVRQDNGRWIAQTETPGELSRGGRDLLAGAALKLLAGRAEITFDSGARTILSGPAEFVVREPNRLELMAGQLTARVPPRAVGFQVDAPYLRAVDLGTEFAVEVTPTEWTELHVFDGAVQAEAVAASGRTYWQRKLVSREAVRLVHAAGQSKEPQLAAAEPRRFVRTMVPQQPPRPYAFYPFDGDATDASGHGRDAVRVSNITFEPGHEGQAARFAGTVDSLIDLPIDAGTAAMPKLTWGCWVRINSLGPEGNEIISIDNGGFDRMLTIDRRGGGEPRDRWAMMVGNQQVAACLEPEPILGQWTFVACVYDNTRRTATLYVEEGDRLVATHREKVQFGPSANFIRLGMHPLGIAEALDGAIDNLFVFDAALKQPQIEAIRRGDIEMILPPEN